jgi:hypothetical protein
LFLGIGIVRAPTGDTVNGFPGFEDCDKIYSTNAVPDSTETPWFDSWRGLFLDLVRPGDHEFLSHVVSCLFVVSERDPPHESVAFLYKKLHQELRSKTFFNSPLNYYVVVHDASSGDPAM